MANNEKIINISGKATLDTSDAENKIDNLSSRAQGLQNQMQQGGSGSGLAPRGDAQQPMTLSDRLTADVRREMASRGVMFVPGTAYSQQFVSAVINAVRGNAQKEIENKSLQEKTDTQTEYENKRKLATDNLEQERAQALSRVIGPTAEKNVNERYDKQLQRINENIDIEQALKFKGIEDESDAELANTEKELAKIAEQLVQEIKSGNNSNSYLGNLRIQQREAIQRRDSAETLEDAQKASAEIADINKRIARATGGGRNPITQMSATWGGINSGLRMVDQGVSAYFRNTAMEVGEINSAANGNAFGAMQQDLERERMNWGAKWAIGGGAVGAILGAILGSTGTFGLGSGAGFMGGMAFGTSVGTGVGNMIFNWSHGAEENQIKMAQMWQEQEQRFQQFNALALMTMGVTRNGLDAERKQWLKALQGGEIGMYTTDNPSGITFNDLGYTGAQFSQIAAQRIKQRGFIGDANTKTLNGGGNYTAEQDIYRAVNQIALERAYNMSEGSIAQYSTYDRYSRRGIRNDANQDVANLVASLSAMNTLGMSGGQTLRANEFLGYQTQLMELQKGWMDAPSSRFATQMLLAGQNLFGDNFDSRAISEISQIQGAITNPKEDYSKAILYDVIQNTIPGTKGNLLAIRQAQYSDDVEVRNKIQTEMFKRLTEIYGSVDTTSGYLALSSYTGIQDPDRLRRWVGQMQKGLPNVTSGDVNKDVAALKEYTPTVSKKMLEYQDITSNKIAEHLGNLQGLSERMLDKFGKKLDEIIEKI